MVLTSAGCFHINAMTASTCDEDTLQCVMLKESNAAEGTVRIRHMSGVNKTNSNHYSCGVRAAVN